MAGTNPGPRDHLITRALERDLVAIARDVLEESPLDAAEAPERLARHAMGELRRELGAEDESADAQARRVNELLDPDSTIASVRAVGGWTARRQPNRVPKQVPR